MTASALEEEMAYQLRAMKIAYVQEYRFHPKRRWRFDFVIAGSKVALEIEGGTWIQGGHSRPKGFEDDCEKYSEAAVLGWCVLRATASQVRSGAALDLVTRALAKEEE